MDFAIAEKVLDDQARFDSRDAEHYKNVGGSDERERERADAWEAVKRELARLREEAAALKGNKWAGFTDHRLSVLHDAIYVRYAEDQQEAECLQREVAAELKRREATQQ